LQRTVLKTSCNMQIVMCCYLRQDRSMTYYLHDAVYLYLLTLNQTLAEGNLDHRDGRLIRNNTIGQRFTGTLLAATSQS